MRLKARAFVLKKTLLSCFSVKYALSLKQDTSIRVANCKYGSFYNISLFKLTIVLDVYT